MSVRDDNINFISSILSIQNPAQVIDLNFTYGLWVSSFENVNLNIDGYSFAEWLVEDIVAYERALTGTVWTPEPNAYGKIPKSRFFITKGVMGQSSYESLEPIAEITDSHVSGSAPSISIPGVTFSGKIYRRCEITGVNISSFSNQELLVISGEDWEDSKLLISGNNLNFTYEYFDTGYSGYSNEVSTRYKFLYDDSSVSPIKNYLKFDMPSRLEEGSSFKYRVSRKSDPFGSFLPPEIDGGQLLINYVSNEISGRLTSSVKYNFSPVSTIIFSSSEVSQADIKPKPTNDESITGFTILKFANPPSNYIQIDGLSTGSYSGIYRLNILKSASKFSDPITISGYVMSGYSGSGIGSKIMTIGVGSGVYSRYVDDGDAYSYRDFLTDEEMKRILKEQEDEEKTSSVTTDTETIELRDASITQEDIYLLDKNSEPQPIKIFLPNFPLPKKIISKGYYSNYLNSGENYIITPTSDYFKPIHAFCGDQSAVLGRKLGTEEVRLINSTTDGLRIGDISFCKGDTALDDNRRVNDNVFIENGTVTRIPSDGIIKKENYKNQEAWLNAINYFYTKNYVASFTIQPSLAESSYSAFFNGALSRVKQIIGAPILNSSENSFLTNGGSVPRIFVEREIYTEPYNNNQISEFNRSLVTGSKTTDDTKLSTAQDERLYCVQSYGYSPGDSSSFLPTQSFDETLKFKSFLEHDSLIGYFTGDSVGKLLFIGDFDKKTSFREEYVTGATTSFSYDSYSTSAAWTGLNGASISIVNENIKDYAYHLYSYALPSDALTFNKSNVTHGDTASVNLTKAVVLKFSKNDFENKLLQQNLDIDLDGVFEDYNVLLPSVTNSDLQLVNPDLIRFNIQIYEYKLSTSEAHQWSTFNKNPINDNNYGDKTSPQELTEDEIVNIDGYHRPSFFEEDSLAVKNSSAVLFDFPNGPFTSKNHEGSPVSIADINSLGDGLFENNIIIIEESKRTLFYESNCVLDFVIGRTIAKQATPSDVGETSFSDTRRLKVTKIKYNFYTKNLLIIGDAGSRDSINFNDGWKYELQYKEIGEINWKKVIESNTFVKDEIACRFGILPPNYLDFKQEVHFLSMVAFEVNLPLFLDDNDYEFKIVKYEKLAVSTSSVDVIKKTNFIPIQASWSGNAACSRFDIYQKDSGNNLTLLGSELVLKTYSYAVPDVKQSYIDMGLANFGSLNYSGYYDIVVSGIVPSTTKVLSSLSGEYGFKVGDTSSDLKVSKFSDLNTVTTAVPVSGVTYSPILNFNNPESKNSAFEINQNHNGYYFVTDSATSTLNGITGQAFEAYVANTGSSNCSVGGATLSGGYVAAVSGTLPIVTSGLQVLGSASLSLNDISNNNLIDVIYLKNNFTLSDPGDKEFYLINDSASSITGYYNSIYYSFTGGKTFRMTSTASALTTGLTLSNADIQDDYIYSNAGLTNFDHLNLTLSSAVAGLPVYNASKNSLKINNVTTLASDSFNLVTWDGVNAPSVALKNYFDGIRIYLKGGEGNDLITLLKDDTEIIITYFTEDTSNTYYFLKDESVARDLNIKIINGSSTTLIPSQKQDFQLIVTRDTNGINFKITQASINPTILTTEAREQLIILKGNSAQEINLKDAGYSLYQNSFVYFVNKSSEDASFTYGIEKTALSQNQIARIFLKDSQATVEILTQARSHFEFIIDPVTHLNSTINILNLDFCDTEINFPDVSNFNGKETFLICKNRLFPNKINTSILLDEFDLLDQFKNLNLNSMFLNVRKKESFDSSPTISKISFLNLVDLEIVPKETTPDSQAANYFYVNETGLSDFTLRDFYNRKSSYGGKIFLPASQVIDIRSFDEKNSILNLESRSLSFDYDPDEDINGRLEAREMSDEIVLSRESQKGSTAITFNTVLETDQICANFAYDSVFEDTTNKTLAKNRLVRNGSSSTAIFPIYNKDEFFIARKITGDSRTVNKNIYYIISAYETDVNAIIIPDAFGATDIVIKNNSSRPFVVKTLNGGFSTSTLPNAQRKFVFTSVWTESADATTITNALIIKSSNQGSEIDSDHPLFGIWDTNAVDYVHFLNRFIPDSTFIDFSLVDGVNKYEIIDVDSVSTITASVGLRIYCYGRKAKTQVALAGRPYFVNAFYLYADFAGSIVKRNEFYFQGSVEPLTVIERRYEDLLKYFRSSNVDDLPSVIFIPIASQLVTYHLPNLYQPVVEGGPSLGSIISGKKIIFVNLVRANSSTPNQIVNYSDASTENLLDINSLLVYQASTTDWTKLTSGLPVVQTVYPTLKGVKGVNATSDSINTNGNEIVYLSNFDKFYISQSSFKSNTYENFYLYNSCSYSIRIKEINKPDLLFHDLAKFSKISIDASSGTFKSENMVSGGLPSLITTTDKAIISKILKSGTIIKFIEDLSTNVGTVDDPIIVKSKSIKVYKCDQTGTPVEILIENICTLNLSDLKTYASNDKLFIYGSSRINEAGLSFDSYDLTLLNVTLLGSEKFYVHNASKSILKIFIGELTFGLPVARTLEISKDGISYMESHPKGMFYTNTKVTNKNYLSKSKINIFADALIDYQFVDTQTYFEKIKTGSPNVAISLLQDSGGSPDIYVYDFSNFTSPENLFLSLGILSNYYDNKKITYFISNNGQLMIQKIDVFNIKKPSISVSTAGHYIVNDNNNDISVTVGSEIFLVNNSVKDVSVKLSSGANLSPTLFRNTVLVINSSGEIRYLKKAKTRDEFYCVFNPRTTSTIITQDALDNKLKRTKDILPIFSDLSGEFSKSSYVKFLSKAAQTRFVYLSIRDYYNGIDIPTDFPENILVYEIGIGHEVIYKFLFFDPSESIYTLPGIEKGSTYIVEADTNLFYNLKEFDGNYSDKIDADPYVKYDGKKYKHGETFIGGAVSNYEIKYPNYVRVAKTIQNLEKTFDKFEGQPDEVIDLETTGITKIIVVKPDEKLELKEQILSRLREELKDVKCWLPRDASAFWQDSSFQKDIFTITEVFQSDTKTIATQDETQYVSFVKCSMKKDNIKQVISEGSDTYYSALQPMSRSLDYLESVVGKDGSFKAPIGIGEDWSDDQLKEITARLKEAQNDRSYVLNQNCVALTELNGIDILVDGVGLDITISLEKLKTMPTIEFEDFSQSEIIKLLNEKQIANKEVIKDTEVENE